MNQSRRAHHGVRRIRRIQSRSLRKHRYCNRKILLLHQQQSKRLVSAFVVGIDLSRQIELGNRFIELFGFEKNIAELQVSVEIFAERS